MANSDLVLYVLNVKRQKALRKRLASLIIVLSLIITSCVSWGLKLTGITMAGDAYCGIEEHTHSDACYNKTLICEISENEEHSHSEDCYNSSLSCALKEHIHSTACYSNPDADTEIKSEWESTFSNVNITGNYAQNLVSIAETQIGYFESVRNFTVDENGNRHGYTRYGEWYGNPYADWSAMFVSFCLSYASVPSDACAYNAGVDAMFKAWSAAGLISEPEHVPVVGDILFFDRDFSGSPESMGILSAVDGETLIIIEGNFEDRVTKHSICQSDGIIAAFGSIKAISYKTDSFIDDSRVANTIKLIDELPSYEQIAKKLGSLSSEEEQDKYLFEISRQALNIYVYYEDLSDELRARVSNYDKLAQLESLYSVQLTAVENVHASVSVGQVNKYTTATTTLVYGGSVRAKLGTGMSFTYWDVMVIEVDSDGNYYLAKYVKTDGSKLDYAATSADGFVLLLYSTTVNATVGNGVIPFGYKTQASGTVQFGTIVAEEPEVPNVVDIVQSADTAKLVEVNLYEYGNNINDMYKNDPATTKDKKLYPGFQQDFGTLSVTSLSRFGMNFGNNITSDLLAGLSGVTAPGANTINATSSTNAANEPISGALKDTLQNGYPALKDGKTLDWLFKTNTYAQKVNNVSINGLFKYNSTTGEYSFNSRENHAQYNSSNDTFTLYKQIITSNFIMYPFGNFLPFNDIINQTTQVSTIDKAYFDKIAKRAAKKATTEDSKFSGLSAFGISNTPYATLANVLPKYVNLMTTAHATDKWNYLDAVNKYFGLNGITFMGPPDNPNYFDDMYSIDYDIPTDFYFGMDMHMNFIQPKNGLTGLDGKQEMIFYFTGDDDVWVYIDNKLALDLSGIHRHVGGKIDFVRGTVSYYNLVVGNGDVAGDPAKVVTFAELFGAENVNSAGTFKNYSSHKFDFYYMERGAGSGVCRMNFNMPLIHKNSISVAKELTSDSNTDALGNPDFSFQIFNEDGSALFIGANYEYSVYNAEGMKIGTAATDENGVFKLKDGQRAVFENIPEDAGRYFVRELLDYEYFDQYGKVDIDGRSTTSSSYGNVTVGSDTFKGVDSTVKDMSDGSTLFTFSNNVTFNKLGSLELTKKLDEEGSGSNESFSFNVSLDGALLPIGTKYILIDADGSETEKIIEGAAGSISLKSNQIARINGILAGSEFEITENIPRGYTAVYSGSGVTDTNSKAAGFIPVSDIAQAVVTNTEKGTSLSIPINKGLINDDGEAHLYQFSLVQVTDPTGTSPVEGGKELTAELETSSESGTQFNLPYRASDFEIGDTTLYYKITELPNPSDLSTIYDDTAYIVEVTVTNLNGGEISARIDSVFKDGVAISQNNITFTNELLRSLKIEKRIEGPITTKNKFTFKIVASDASKPLIGTYPVSGNQSIGDVTFINGEATVKLGVGEALTICGLPISAVWSVEEIGAAGYFTKVSTNSSEWENLTVASGSLSQNTEVIFINIAGTELPETGSLGNIIFTFGGVLLMALPLMYGFGRRRRRERRVM